MLVKRNKKGIVLALDWHYRSALYNSLIDELKTSFRITLTSEKAVLESLHRSVLINLVQRKNFNLDWANDYRFTLTTAEALALMLHLRKHDNTLELLQLKSEIHKQLHA